jgi:hypothetical protein
MKKTSIAYASVIIASGVVIGTTYSDFTNAMYPPLENLSNIISQPEFLTTACITITAVFALSGIIHIIGKRAGGKVDHTIPKLKSTTGETSTITGFRVGTKTGTGSVINNDSTDTKNNDNLTPNLKSGEVSGFRVGKKTATGT